MTPNDEMVDAMKFAAEHARALANKCLGGGPERFRDARISANVAKATYEAAVDIRDGYGGLKPEARYKALQWCCETITGCIESIESMMAENRHATDAGDN